MNNKRFDSEMQKKKGLKNCLIRILNCVDAWAIIFLIAMIIPNILLDITEPMSIWGKIANILVPLSIYALLLGKVKRTGALILWLFIMMVMNGFQIVLYYLYGESIIAIDMLINCVTSNPGEAGELLSNLTLPIVIDSVIYIPLILWAIYASLHKPSLRSSDKFRKKANKCGLIGLSTGIIFAIIATIVGPRYSVGRDLYPFNVISNIGSALQRIGQSVNYHNTSKDFIYNAEITDSATNGKRDIIVLVIGETSRAGNWQLFGHDRETNPLLSKRNDLILFPKAISQSNTTHKCVPLMLTPIAPNQFDSIMYYKSAITAFKEAGFRTSFYSNQSKNHSYTQFFSEEADSLDYLDADHHLDHYLVDLLNKDVSDTTVTRQFIILHTYGSHFNYRDRYTDEFSHFKPDNSTNANPKHREVLLNAYDNSLRYIDNYLNELIGSLEKTGDNVALIFASDHGEDIFDDSRERFLHASPVATYYQLHVPMFMWFSESYREQHPDIVAAVESNREKYTAPSQAIFHTLMSLGGISTPYLDATNSVASTDYRSPDPVYLNDYNEAVPLGTSGLKKEDIKIFRNLGIL